MENKVFLTEEGLKQLKERLDFLKVVKRPECSEKIQVARSLGDLSENFEYISAKEEQGAIESEIFELEEKLRNAEVISKKVDTSKVTLGCLVKIYNELLKQEATYRIVGSSESDPANGFLSNESLAGKALMGAKVGDTVVYKSINAGDIAMKVLEISK
ncbi:MAG: transcription elongation factor GreA [Clostridia bacterium]|nr:transcription elongation factor GreA [Clostridia bacterium]